MCAALSLLMQGKLATWQHGLQQGLIHVYKAKDICI